MFPTIWTLCVFLFTVFIWIFWILFYLILTVICIILIGYVNVHYIRSNNGIFFDAHIIQLHTMFFKTVVNWNEMVEDEKLSWKTIEKGYSSIIQSEEKKILKKTAVVGRRNRRQLRIDHRKSYVKYLYFNFNFI